MPNHIVKCYILSLTTTLSVKSILAPTLSQKGRLWQGCHQRGQVLARWGERIFKADALALLFHLFKLTFVSPLVTFLFLVLRSFLISTSVPCNFHCTTRCTFTYFGTAYTFYTFVLPTVSVPHAMQYCTCSVAIIGTCPIGYPLCTKFHTSCTILNSLHTLFALRTLVFNFAYYMALYSWLSHSVTQVEVG